MSAALNRASKARFFKTDPENGARDEREHLVANPGVYRPEENNYEDLCCDIGRYFADAILCSNIGCKTARQPGWSNSKRALPL